jgi:hypothetical protein
VSIEITPGQLSRLRKAHTEITSVLEALGALDVPASDPEPEWKTIQRKQWRLLNAVVEAGGDLGSKEWSRLGAQHGYDPRGLGGFFRGHEQLMKPDMAEQGARRVITVYGRRFVEQHKHEYTV